jgi:hypothetical protein
MNKDFNISADYADHCHIRLLGFVSKWRPKGVLTGMDDSTAMVCPGLIYISKLWKNRKVI